MIMIIKIKTNHIKGRVLWSIHRFIIGNCLSHRFLWISQRRLIYYTHRIFWSFARPHYCWRIINPHQFYYSSIQRLMGIGKDPQSSFPNLILLLPPVFHDSIHEKSSPSQQPGASLCHGGRKFQVPSLVRLTSSPTLPNLRASSRALHSSFIPDRSGNNCSIGSSRLNS